jgi:hypothetical protein
MRRSDGPGHAEKTWIVAGDRCGGSLREILAGELIFPRLRNRDSISIDVELIWEMSKCLGFQGMESQRRDVAFS